jgi:hypothetical protein
MNDLYEECDAGIAGGCGACKKCDPEWWINLEKEQTEPKCLNCKHWNLDGKDITQFQYCANEKIETLLSCEDAYCGIQYSGDFVCKFFEVRTLFEKCCTCKHTQPSGYPDGSPYILGCNNPLSRYNNAAITEHTNCCDLYEVNLK